MRWSMRQYYKPPLEEGKQVLHRCPQGLGKQSKRSFPWDILSRYQSTVRPKPAQN